MNKIKHTSKVLDEFFREVFDWNSKTSKFVRGMLSFFALVFLTFSNIQLKQQVKDLTIEISNLQSSYAKEKATNKILLLRQGSMLQALNDVPIPFFVKELDEDGELRMIFINRAYVSTFLEDRGYDFFDYANETDYCCWDEDIATAFIKNDMYVLENNISGLFPEYVTNASGKKEVWLIGKYPSTDENGNRQLIGIAIQKQ